MKKLFLFLLALLLLGALVLPGLIGWIARDQLEQQLVRFSSESPDWQLQSIGHSPGWLRSSSRWSLVYQGSDPWQGTRLVINQTWQHGHAPAHSPFQQWTLAASELRGAVELPGQGPLAVDGLAQLGYGLGLNATLRWQSHAAVYDELSWDLAPGAIVLRSDLGSGDWQVEINSAASQIGQQGQSATWQSLSLEAQYRAAGDARFSLRSEDWSGRGITAGRLEIDWHGTQQGDQLWSFDVEVKTEQAAVNGLNGVDLEASARLTDLHGPSLTQMAQGFGDVSRAQLSRDDARNAQLAVALQHLPALLQARPALRMFDLHAQTERGGVDVEASITLDNATQLQLASPLLLEQAVDLQADIAISDDLLRLALLRRYQREAGQWHQGAADRPLYQRLADDQIDSWIERGWLERREGHLHTTVNLARGGWLVNDEPWMRLP